LTEAVRIVTRVTGQVRVSAGDVHDFGYHVVWWPSCRRPVLLGAIAGCCEELIGAKVGQRGGWMVAPEIMPGHVHLLVKPHGCDCPPRGVGRFKGFTARRLRAGFPPLWSRRPALWSRSYFAAAVSVVLAGAVRRYLGRQDERPWRKEWAR
jgi:putative transposase